MDAGAAPMGKSSLAVLAVDQSAIFEIAERQPNCNTTDVKATAELVLTRYGERGGIIPAKNLLCYCSD
jgi:hypothetical protein